MTTQTDLGISKTTQFMLSTAEVRLGAQSKLFDLNTDNSIGLVKNVAVTSESESAILTQGLRNKEVYSVINSCMVNFSMEVYEYTAANMAYGLSLSAGAGAPINTATTTTAAVTGNGTIKVLPVTSNSGFAVGDYILIATGKGIMANTITISAATSITVAYAFPMGTNIRSGATVTKVNALDLGNPEDVFYGCNLIGRSSDKKDLVFYLPKVKIMRGFNVQYGSEDYGNMPFEFKAFSLVTSDNFADLFGQAQGKCLVAQ